MPFVVWRLKLDEGERRQSTIIVAVQGVRTSQMLNGHA